MLKHCQLVLETAKKQGAAGAGRQGQGSKATTTFARHMLYARKLLSLLTFSYCLP